MSTTVEIVKTPDALGGKPRIEGTRVGIFQIGEMVRRGEWSVGAVVDELDLTREQVDAALDYYDDHPDEMETLRARREATVREVREGGRTPDS